MLRPFKLMKAYWKTNKLIKDWKMTHKCLNHPFPALMGETPVQYINRTGDLREITNMVDQTKDKYFVK